MNEQARPRILFVAGCWYPVPRSPAQGIFVRRHAEAVARQHPVVVLHPTADPEAPRRPNVQWQRWGDVHEVFVRFRGRAIDDQLVSAGQLAYLRAGLIGGRAIRRRWGEPDIVHHHVVPSAGLTAALRLLFPAAPMVLTEHWTGYLPEIGVRLGSLRRLYTAWMTRRCGAVTTVSGHLRRVMLGHGFHGRYRVISNVVDTELFRPAASTRSGPFRFVHVSCIRPVKRVLDIVRVSNRLLEEGTDLELHVVGDGPQRQPATELAAELQLLDRKVFFHGQQDGAGVARHLRDNHALVLFSDFENSPCVIGEALASGIPVVAPRIAGIPEHVNDEHGVLVEPGDPDSLKAAMRSLATGQRRFAPEDLRRYAERTFSPQVIGESFAEVYRKVLGRAEAGSTPRRSNSDP